MLTCGLAEAARVDLTSDLQLLFRKEDNQYERSCRFYTLLCKPSMLFVYVCLQVFTCFESTIDAPEVCICGGSTTA